jgi:type I site-specific restriction endonuclease
VVQEVAALNIHAPRGVAVREFPLGSVYGFADYLLYVDQRVVGVVEAKMAGTPLTGRSEADAAVPRARDSVAKRTSRSPR